MTTRYNLTGSGRMTMTLHFNLDDVRRVVEHARRAADHREYYGERLGPRVMLVKDEGIYLMSNGLPRDIRDGGADQLGAHSFVAYADGYNPAGADPGDLHMRCRAAVGGDDFSEPIELDGFESALADPKVTGLALRVSPQTIDLVVYERAPKRRRS